MIFDSCNIERGSKTHFFTHVLFEIRIGANFHSIYTCRHTVAAKSITTKIFSLLQWVEKDGLWRCGEYDLWKKRILKNSSYTYSGVPIKGQD